MKGSLSATYVLLALLVSGAATTTVSATNEAMTHKAFFAAVDKGDVAAVTAGLDAHPEWLQTTGSRWDAPPLRYAANEGHTEIVRLLIARGADVNGYDPKWRWRPIHEAASRGHVDVVRLLLDHGAKMNVRNRDKHTPLAMAAGKSHREVVVLLLQRGAPVDERIDDGWSLLHTAADLDDREMAGLLLGRGLGVDVTTDAGHTPLHWAASTDAAALLIAKGANINARGAEGRTPLHLAAFFGRDDVARRLIDGGADVNAADAKGRTPLDLAKAENRGDAITMLTAAGAKPGVVRERSAERTATRIGPKGQFILNGKPIIPFGVWQQPPRLFAYNKAIGMDCLVYPTGGGLGRGDSSPRYVAAAESENLGAFIHYDDKLVDQPSVWGWVGGGWTANAARRSYERLRRKDDGRVIICNFGGHGLVKPRDVDRKFYRSVFPYIDCLVPHVWPEMFKEEPRNLRNVAMMVDTARAFSKDRPNGEVSIWADINPHQWHKGERACQAPTVEEFRYQVWVALIHGADGICLFTISFDPFVYSQIPAKMAESLPGMISQVKRFTGALTAAESPREIRVGAEGGDGVVDVTTRRFEGDDYVFLVNSPDTAQTLRLTTPGLGKTCDLYDATADAGKVLAATDGAYSEKTPPLALRVWRISPRSEE